LCAFLSTSVPVRNSREDCLDITLGLAALAYFVLVGPAFAAGEGDAAGLAVVLGLIVAGVVSPAGVADWDDAAGDDAGLGVVDSDAGSQAAARAMTRIVVNSNAARRIDFVIGLLISFASFEQD
jgi:hypothetical protein